MMKRKFKVLLVIGILSLICGCGTKGNDSTLSMEEQLQNIIAENNYIIVDVRTLEEYNSGHVKGAINIPYDKIDENSGLDKSKKIIVYCKSGKRSGMAYDTLTKLGYDVLDLGAYETITLEKE